MVGRKWKVIRGVLWVGALVTLAYCFLVYRRFHDPYAWIVRSPANPRWAVDCRGSGFVDLGFDFRVHDLTASRLRPLRVCDLYWENLHSPGELHWSKDGTVAAITILFRGGGGELYGCAYDFREHKSYRSGSSGSPLEPSPELSQSIADLIASRGGKSRPIEVPDPTKIYSEHVD
jgi:hypothetical protein